MINIISVINNIKINDLILHIQNISLFSISIFSLFAYVYYNTQILISNNLNKSDFIWPYEIIIPYICIHSFVDLFITRSFDVKIHHIFILGIFFYNYYYNITNVDIFIFSYHLLKTEITSIFYVLKFWLPTDSYIYNINNFLFYILFFKFRIIDFYYGIIQNNYVFKLIINKYSQTNDFLTTIIVLSCYGLYILNIYWFLIMTKILYKNISKVINIDTYIICHYLCSYIHFINIPLCIYIYSDNKNEKYILDIIGVTGVSITSYYYHINKYNNLYIQKIDEIILPNKYKIVLFFNDVILIQIRSFLTIATSYYNDHNFLYYITISGLFHLISIYYVILNIFKLLFTTDNLKDYYLNIHYLITCLPIIIDVILIYFNSTTEIGIPFILVNIIIFLILFVKPFYKLTHVALHIFLIIHNYYLCLSHSIH